MTMKKCNGPLCEGVLKPICDFPWRNKSKGIRQSACRECRKHYSAKHYEKNRDSHIKKVGQNKFRIKLEKFKKVRRYFLSHPCVDCGEKNPLVLQFDHVRGKKLGDVSTMIVNGVAWSKISDEINKCDVRCANCHSIKTAKERSFLMWQILEEE